MLVAGVVIETLPGTAPAVAERVKRLKGLSLFGSDGDHQVMVVSRLRGGAKLEGLLEALGALDEAVLGVHPTAVTEEDD